jgi:hypothetical protein
MKKLNEPKCLRWLCFILLIQVSIMTAHGVEESVYRLLPWQYWDTVAGEAKELSNLVNDKWYSSGGKEGILHISKENGPWGGKYFRFAVTVDHYNDAQYPRGWPSFQWKMEKPIDMAGWDVIQYWVRVESTLKRSFPISFIMRAEGKGVLQEVIKPSPDKQWRKINHRIRDRSNIDKVMLLHFFISESSYSHGDEMVFEIGGFQLANDLTKRPVSRLSDGETAMGMWVGARADRNDEIVILEENTLEIPILLTIETAANSHLRRDDELSFRFHEVFSGQEWTVKERFGQDVTERRTARIEHSLPLPELVPGYYLISADLRRNENSLLSGRVGSDDLYIRGPEESMTYTVLSLRTGMVLPLQDLMGSGIIMGHTNIALPHTYDPLNKETYGEFLQLFGASTGMQAEGIEAGLTGLLFAAEAFHKSGDAVRARFTENIIEDCVDNMLTRWQAPNGGVVIYVSAGAKGPPPNHGYRNPDQMGEWIRPLTYAMLYYSRIHKGPDLVSKISRACRKAADYMLSHSRETVDGIPGSIRHFVWIETKHGLANRRLHHQEGIQCDVYLGRILSGVSYYAYAIQAAGETVPQRYWDAMDSTVKWCRRKMKPNGWFDWQCGYKVEGGCHPGLGNIYVGEGLFGCYLANRRAGRLEQASEALKAAQLAYRFLMDAHRPNYKEHPPLEFWVGPYVYWLFTEYLDAVGSDPIFRSVIESQDRQWREERQWKDFLWRGHGDTVYRSKSNGFLTVSILGYLGLKQMEVVGEPFHLPFPE